MLGFDAENSLFAENSWYFRNALVRANYNDIKNGIYETTEYLEKFLRNLLLDEKHELHNREMHISGKYLQGHDDPIKLEKREQQIIDLLSQKSDMTGKEMGDKLRCSEATVKRELQKLVEKGAIKRVGANKKGEWIILDQKS